MGDAAVNGLIGVLGRGYRQRRIAMFIDTLKPTRETRVLDVGGSERPTHATLTDVDRCCSVSGVVPMSARSCH